MDWQDTIKAAHLSVCDAVSRYKRLKSDRYFVWAEDGKNDLCAGNAHVECAVMGTTDLYTKIPDDPWSVQIERAFNEYGIAWYKTSTQYEEDTGYIHHEWAWEVT